MGISLLPLLYVMTRQNGFLLAQIILLPVYYQSRYTIMQGIAACNYSLLSYINELWMYIPGACIDSKLLDFPSSD